MPHQVESTRRQILELIKRQGEMTAGQLSEAIGITSMGVRQHLNSLERDGLIATQVGPAETRTPISPVSADGRSGSTFPVAIRSVGGRFA